MAEHKQTAWYGTKEANLKSNRSYHQIYRINHYGTWSRQGLTISEKMRDMQSKGLNRAYDKCTDGISLIQVAEGALNETHAILQRMNELATYKQLMIQILQLIEQTAYPARN